MSLNSCNEINLSSPYGIRETRNKDEHKFIDFTLKGYDLEIGAVRMGRRFYDPVAKRFLTPDSYLMEKFDKCFEFSASCNLYGYARNNPLSFTDPTGQYENVTNYSEEMTLTSNKELATHVQFVYTYGGESHTANLYFSGNDGNVSLMNANGKESTMSIKEFVSTHTYTNYFNGKSERQGFLNDKAIKDINYNQKLSQASNTLATMGAVASANPYAKAASRLLGYGSAAISGYSKDLSGAAVSILGENSGSRALGGAGTLLNFYRSSKAPRINYVLSNGSFSE